jgi:hypothetical protein
MNGSSVLQVIETPTHPECLGSKWVVVDEQKLVEILTRIFVGRTDHARSVLKGVGISNASAASSLKQLIHKELHPSSDAAKYHRDGLIFEFITWIFAVLSNSEVVTQPHPKSTFQGTDGLRVDVDSTAGSIKCLHVHEVKCTNDTSHSRSRITADVFPSFDALKRGEKDREVLLQLNALLESAFPDAVALSTAIDVFQTTRPIAFHACVTANPLDEAGRAALFADYSDLEIAIENRNGHTFEHQDVRAWFEQISQKIWQSVEGLDETCSTQQVNA